MIELRKISKTYNGKDKIIDNLNLIINEGEIIALIGESGCGKTTTMKMINLLEKPSSGEILINGINIINSNITELRRNIGYVIQKVGLFPHMTVGENIELVPKLKKWNKEKRKEKSYELLKLVDLDPEIFYNRYPQELSGGQQQRIGIARSLAADPKIILMDEPFSALDPLTREMLQDELLKIQSELQKTIIFVTHDMDEAIKIADKIAVMKDGKILQFDRPEQILKNPKNEYIEFFIGKERLWKTPEMVLAKDIMQKKFAKINKEGSVAKAIEIMKEKSVETLFVVEKIREGSQKILGVITPKNLKSYDNFFSNDKSNKVKEYMSEKYISVDENSNMLDVLNIMSAKNFRNIVVLNSLEEVVGLITPTSMLNIISEISPSKDKEVNEIE
ncbi:MAG: betaine/proline/choline family ABC transporter ATP-binding protein [Fusobacteriaceae bacterium]|nr:betaine/proline/choline family ABC transporter ATP-binding protein [Fusobacteriaceae bacterium]MBN2839062.1 betaine/proline/choline family ABC transporter ATP-binding protein [Fusobacteriaceae bacterium]